MRGLEGADPPDRDFDDVGREHSERLKGGAGTARGPTR